MRKHNYNELSKQSEKRLKRRLRSNEQKQNQKQIRLREKERDTLVLTQFRGVLKKQKRDGKKTPKRSGLENFLPFFSFLPFGRYDKRHTLAVNEWISHSFNEKRQTLDFFHSFVYPYPVPEPLVFTSIQEDLINDEHGNFHYTPDFAIIQKSKKWLSDIIKGGSFYKNNKDCFTKAEAHYFLSSQIKYKDNSSIIAMYFEAKCKARNFGISLCAVVTKVFTIKFLHSYNCPIVTGFLDLIARHSGYHFTVDELGDICDFVNTKITKYQQSFGSKMPFSFSGRTIASVTSLANEWHIQNQKEIKLWNRLGYKMKRPRAFSDNWTGLAVNNYKYESKNYLWMINQLCTVHELINEGRKMKHCVSSYAYKCFNNECGIFNVSCVNKSANAAESVATIEISSRYEIVQMRGKCNARVTGKVTSVVARWAQQERLKYNTILGV